MPASARGSCARLPRRARAAAGPVPRPQPRASDTQAPSAAGAQAAGSLRPASAAMSVLSAIANTLAQVFSAVAVEIGRQRRRERNFRLLSRRHGGPPVGRRLRFLHMTEPHVSFLNSGTRLGGSWRR